NNACFINEGCRFNEGGSRLRKKVFPILLLLGVVVLLAGCTDIKTPINAESTGIWNKYFVYRMSQFIQFFADMFHNIGVNEYHFGLAIVVVTIIIRTVLLPLNVKQLKSSKAMQDIQPEMKELQKKYSSKDAN